MNKSHLLIREESITNLEDLLCKETNNLFKDVIASMTPGLLPFLNGYKISKDYILIYINQSEKKLLLFDLYNENYEEVNFDFLSQTEQHDLLEHIICNIMK